MTASTGPHLLQDMDRMIMSVMEKDEPGCEGSTEGINIPKENLSQSGGCSGEDNDLSLAVIEAEKEMQECRTSKRSGPATAVAGSEVRAKSPRRDLTPEESVNSQNASESSKPTTPRRVESLPIAENANHPGLAADCDPRVLSRRHGRAEIVPLSPAESARTPFEGGNETYSSGEARGRDEVVSQPLAVGGPPGTGVEQGELEGAGSESTGVQRGSCRRREAPNQAIDDDRAGEVCGWCATFATYDDPAICENKATIETYVEAIPCPQRTEKEQEHASNSE